MGKEHCGAACTIAEQLTAKQTGHLHAFFLSRIYC